MATTHTHPQWKGSKDVAMHQPSVTPPPSMVQVRVWDPWVRLVHWAIVLLIPLSWWSVETDRMELHMLSGTMLLALLIFRLAWGFWGSETARFGAFLRSPVAGLRHLAQLRRREPDTEIGHNAAGGWMVLVMLALLATQAVTGLFASSEPGMSYADHGPLALRVTDDTSEWLTDIHVSNAWVMLAAVALHVLAVLTYRLLKGQDLVGPMLTGRKSLPAPLARKPPRIAGAWHAVPLLALAAAIAFGIARAG
jgi:cytochrome b